MTKKDRDKYLNVIENDINELVTHQNMLLEYVDIFCLWIELDQYLDMSASVSVFHLNKIFP